MTIRQLARGIAIAVGLAMQIVIGIAILPWWLIAECWNEAAEWTLKRQNERRREREGPK